MTEIRTIPGGTPTWVRDATANDSDKSFTVPAGKRWELRSIQAHIATTATVGNRVLRVDITDGTDRIQTSGQSSNIAATQNGTLEMSFGAGLSGTTAKQTIVNAVINVGVQTVSPPCTLLAGYVIRVYDVNAVDAAADDLTVELHYIEYDV